MTNNEEIVVLGGTGKTGRLVTRTLREAGHRVRPASRSGETRFDWADQSSWPAVLEGARALYLVAGPAGLNTLLAARAVEAGVRRLVALSGRGMEHCTPDMFPAMTEAEAAVRESGVEWAIIRANNFHQNFSQDYWQEPLRAGRLALPTAGVAEPFVDTRDIAEVAAALLTRDGLDGRAYDVSGPRALTFAEAVRLVAAAAGRRIDFVDLSPEEYVAELRAEGVAGGELAELVVTFEVLRAGRLAEPADGVRRVLGREPIAFETFAKEEAAKGTWS
ncbi:NmrA family NAD(P)-binding protein [Streptomyces zhaozhouensis]|nr:NmrA family NAD(P)-binding protein [Streptomyces zhaozhouensis]